MSVSRRRRHNKPADAAHFRPVRTEREMSRRIDRLAMRVSRPTLDVADPNALAEFYKRLIGWGVGRREGRPFGVVLEVA